jgi:hypothetical protein
VWPNIGEDGAFRDGFFRSLPLTPCGGCVVCVVVVVFRSLGNIISCSYIFLYDMTFIF